MPGCGSFLQTGTGRVFIGLGAPFDAESSVASSPKKLGFHFKSAFAGPKYTGELDHHNRRLKMLPELTLVAARPGDETEDKRRVGCSQSGG
jgi:hypothetical protein